MILNILTVDTTNIRHSKKRYLRGLKRHSVGKDIKRSSASQWRRIMADQNMDYGDMEPANLYKGSVLRKAKQQIIDYELGVSKTTDSINSIINQKYSSEHQGSIHNVDNDPFYVHYWTPTQEHIYKTYSRENWTTQYIDVTGSLMLSITRTDKKITSAHIFLYQIVIEVNGETVPVTQQISEKQNISIFGCEIG